MGDFLSENRNHIYFGAFALLTFLALKYIFPLIVPFVLAMLIVTAIYPAINRIHQSTRIGKGFLAGLFLLLIFGGMGGLLWLGCSCGIHWLCDKLKDMDYYKEQFCDMIRLCSGRMEQKIGIRADKIENLILERVNIFIDDIEVKIMPGIMNQSLAYLKLGVAVVSFFVVMIIAAILIIKDFEDMKGKLMQLSVYRKLAGMLGKMCKLILSFFRAQLMIMSIVAVICVVGFYLVGSRAFLVLGIVTGLLDALPFVGTGITLLPYMFWKYLNEDFAAGTILLVTFLVSALARELLEPRLIGKKLNILPTLILVSIYAGIKVFGISGVFLGPLYVMVVSEGIRTIYNREEDQSSA